jgi:uncharacterized protein DUF6356
VGIEQVFIRHPRSIGETYLEHQHHALGFGASLVFAGLACIVHGLVPALFPTTGSRTVSRLYQRMVTQRAGVIRITSSEVGTAPR